ncbi:unnamed protein product [Penicillium olsonii]|nr:unnamed protein product [Penicillium olsonii]
MAVYSLVQQMIELRHHLQGVWRQVAYNKMNSAVAANVSKVAIGMIKHTQSQIFVDFPGHDSFDTVMQTLTRGDPDKSQGRFHMQATKQGPGGSCGVSQQQHEIDVREEFFLNGYQDLFDFITDYQHTRSGKPTKSMLKVLQNWNPTLDLARATQKERLQWRRVYTINWLYDLVNVFSSIVVQRRAPKKQNIPLEQVDWSEYGPWSQGQRIYGIRDFAVDITHCAVQKQGTDIRPKILPHHVFQLQCMVDALAVSRGWSIGVIAGHVMKQPANNFQPRRDVDMFMDRRHERKLRGYIDSVDILMQLFERDAMLHGNPNRNGAIRELVGNLLHDFINWLGESKYKYGLTDIPPSRFSNTNANGLWEYSPFLCGAGLSEALELSYGTGLVVWDSVPEPICVIHLHNMLVQKGLLKRPIGLWDSLGSLFENCFFNGKHPTSKFHEAFENMAGQPSERRAGFRKSGESKNLGRRPSDLKGSLDPSENRFYTTKSLLEVYKAADWIPDRIPNEDIPTQSTLAFLRLADSKQIKDPVTGKVTLEDSELVKRLRAAGLSDKGIIDLASNMAFEKPLAPELVKILKASVPEGYTMNEAPLHTEKRKVSLGTYLGLLETDFVSDVSGENRPLSSLNYLLVLARCYILFTRLEEKLRARRNMTWAIAYESDLAIMNQKRLSLTSFALTEKDPQCMSIMAEEFEKMRCGFMDHIYWDDLVDQREMENYLSPEDQTPSGTDACTVM